MVGSLLKQELQAQEGADALVQWLFVDGFFGHVLRCRDKWTSAIVYQLASARK